MLTNKCPMETNVRAPLRGIILTLLKGHTKSGMLALSVVVLLVLQGFSARQLDELMQVFNASLV